MLLSIGMIVKNEEKILRDCLNGIKPVLDHLKCEAELIICDTGSTDRTVEIAKEFTDKIIHIQWKNDFSYARNKILEIVRGKWFFTVDADEIYQDVEDIINFIKSNEIEKYVCASVIKTDVINGKTEDKWPVMIEMKLFKVVKDLRWIGKIHEFLSSAELDEKSVTHSKELKSSMMHYGYNFETEEQKKNKSARNLIPLLEMYEEDPKNVKTLCQIAQEYLVTEEYKEGLKYLLMGRDLFSSDTTNMYYHAIRHNLVKTGYIMLDLKSTIEYSRDYFKTATIYTSNVYYIKHWEARSLSRQQDFGEAAEVAVQALEFYKLSKENKLINAIWNIVSEPPLSEDTLIQSIVSNFIWAGDFANALHWNNEFDDGSPSKISDIYSPFIERIAKNKPENLHKIYDFAASAYELESAAYDNAVTVLEKNITSPEIKAEAAEKFCEYQDPGDSYVYLQQLRYYSIQPEEHPKARMLLNNFLNSDIQFHQRFGDVVHFAMVMGADFMPFLENMHISDSEDFVSKLIDSNAD
ncbi:MAG: glycosyltransferase, partial [Clostridiales bacterium]|nr:glycosyltransferase [Clostridiales bacterium]